MDTAMIYAAAKWILFMTVQRKSYNATFGCYQIRIEHLDAAPVGIPAAFPLHAHSTRFSLPFYHDTKIPTVSRCLVQYLRKLINNICTSIFVLAQPIPSRLERTYIMIHYSYEMSCSSSHKSSRLGDIMVLVIVSLTYVNPCLSH